MRGVIFTGDRNAEVVTVPDPTPGPGEVVIEIRASGMCGTDLHLYRMPANESESVIRGHEPAGVIVAVGRDVPATMVGARVMVHHYFGCASCDQCRSGWSQFCRQGATIYGADANGSHAEYMNVPSATVIPLDERLSFLAGATIGCGTGTAWGAMERAGLTGRETVAIFGQGPVGLSGTILATKLGAQVIAVDIETSRLKRALEAGAHAAFNPTEVPVIEAIRAATNGRGVSISIETSGAPSACVHALDVLDIGGTACYVGIGPQAAYDLRDHRRRQVTAMTSWTMSSVSQERCAAFVADRGIDLDVLFSDEWTLDDAKQAYRALDSQSSGKGVFRPDLVSTQPA